MNWARRSTPDRIMIICFLSVLLLGLFIIGDYGEPWDHLLRYRSGYTTIEIYRNPFVAREGLDFGPSDSRYYGPFMVAFANLIARMVNGLGCGCDPLTIHRYVYFAVFQLGVLAFYFLCKYLISDWAALVAALLFGTQPLLFGNAAANAKDTPFTGLFIIALLAGVWMTDSLRGDPETRPTPSGGLLQNWMKDRDAMPAQVKGRLNAAWLVWLALLVLVVFFQRPIARLGTNLVEKAYFAEPGTIAGRLFNRIAANQQAATLSSYQAKAELMAGRLSWLLLFALIIILLLAAFRQLPRTRLVISSHTPAAVRNPRILLAGIALGLATSVRVLGPAAGGLVVLVYLLRRGVRRSAGPILWYGVVAALTTYLTWPYLWPAPFKHFYESLTIMSSFPHLGKVLFNGQLYPSDQLPLSYLPVLMGIQFTEPVMVLALLGMGVVVARWLERRKTPMKNPSLWLAVTLWLFLPLSMVLVMRPTIYDNFRQFFFITPPLFMFAGATLEATLEGLRKRWMKIMLVVLVLLPGIYHLVKAHPYEYVYYNSYVGGVHGAIDRYHMDYLGLSVKEAVEYLNQNAEANATVLISGPFYEAGYFLRPDLKLIDARDHPGIGERMPEAYWLILNIYRQSDLGRKNTEELFRVKLDDAVLVTVRR